MNLHQERLHYLFEQFFNETAKEEEIDELTEMLEDPSNQDFAFELLGDKWGGFRIEGPAKYSTEKIDAAWEKIIENKRSENKVVEITGRRWIRYVAAASILIVATLGVIFSLPKKEPVNKPIVQIPYDVQAPIETKASITLANGQVVYLDSAGVGTLAHEGNMEVVRNSRGEIVYTSVAAGQSTLVYNTMFNPRGSNVINLTLQDGTKVWLNNESSIKYPAAFIGNERKVEINGEAYFEVAKNASRSFKVKINDGSEVEVLGTHFNVNAYSDDSEVKTTLLEGKVRVTKGANKVVINPGDQAVALSNSSISVNHSADLEQVMAWKNGLFRFRSTNIKEIMKQAERWYNIDVVYEGNVSDLDFSGFVSRKESVSKLLKIFETTGLVHFSVEGNKVIVKK